MALWESGPRYSSKVSEEPRMADAWNSIFLWGVGLTDVNFQDTSVTLALSLEPLNCCQATVASWHSRLEMGMLL